MRKIIKFFLLPLSIFLAIIAISIRPIYLIRFALIPDQRIGHLIKDLSIYYLEKNLSKKNSLDIFCFNEEKYASNYYIKKKWREKLFIRSNLIVHPIIKIINLFYILVKSKNPHQINLTEENKFNIIAKNKKIFSFSENEIIEGNYYLKNIGLKNDDKFIILFIRDEAYLKNKIGSTEFNYHNYRNLNNLDFIPIIKYFISKGFYVFRMGKIVSEKFPYKDKQFIDYPYSKIRSDFMDLYLSSRCEFALSTLTGSDNLPEIFHKPVLGIEYPIDRLNIFNKCKIFTTPMYLDKVTKKILSVNNVLSRLNNSIYDELNGFTLNKLNICILHNSDDDILNAGKEMLEIYKYKDFNFEDQSLFWNNIKNYFEKKKIIYLNKDITSNLSKNFFLKYKNFLES